MARADLSLAALSVITHAKDPGIGEILKTLSTALQGVTEAVSDPIVEFTAQGMGGNRRAAELRRNLVAVDLSFCKSYLVEEIRDEARTESRVQDILLVLETRGLDVPDEVRERVIGCDDPGLLRRWLTRAVTAPSAGEIFTEAPDDV